jgi:hypothetical protein
VFGKLFLVRLTWGGSGCGFRLASSPEGKKFFTVLGKLSPVNQLLMFKFLSFWVAVGNDGPIAPITAASTITRRSRNSVRIIKRSLVKLKGRATTAPPFFSYASLSATLQRIYLRALGPPNLSRHARIWEGNIASCESRGHCVGFWKP